jgi:CRISPR-associated endonuclease/helicase Cas3
MGSGLATTTQLEAFRRLLPNQESEDANDGHGCRSVWMSATLRPEWLGTVDFKDRIDEQGRIDGKQRLSLTKEDHKNEDVEKRWKAQKPLAKTAHAMDEKQPNLLAAEIAEAHRNAWEKVGHGTRTIVVVNTVKRACVLYNALQNELNGASVTDAASGIRARRKRNEPPPEPSGAAGEPKPNLVLLHSRFRPSDRKARVDKALADPPSGGTIVVSTQVIEAGVDVSATTLFTELAPWASLVQRFGRCNRRGEQNAHASVWWIDVSDKDAAPYDRNDLKKARDTLADVCNKPEAEKRVGPAALSTMNVDLPFQHTHVIRRKDLIDLFDTTPDLAGNDIDIDRFVREIEDSDVRVFWRAWDRPKGHEPPPDDEPAPRREELCPAPIGEFRDFAKKRGAQVWRWNFLDKKWERPDSAKIAPGQVFLVHADAGGYAAETGWSPGRNVRVDPIALPSGAVGETLDGTDSDRLSRVGVWQTIAEHTNAVCRELGAIVHALALADSHANVLYEAARHHDWGKAHQTFVAALPDGAPDATQHWAKAIGTWKRYKRQHFRHELASAMAVLLRPHECLKVLSDDDMNLVAYLVAAHHGKVRLSIRSLPNEARPDGDLRFARGVWDGDELPETDLGKDGDGRQITAPKVTLSLEPMELGLCEQPPFAGQPSWAERMLRLRDTLGPFRLAYLEAILRAADMRASKAAEQRAAGDHHAGASTVPKGVDCD